LFRRILVANRGEIALRIVRTCRELGVQTVVVYSEADRDAPWLEQADRTVCIGPARPGDSYLNQAAILQAAEQTECGAIHPGYGFLSENAVFAARCEQQGLSFIGPSSGAIRRMGNKAAARQAMSAAGLASIPGSAGVLPDARRAAACADEIGYPVLLKASAGGGGKGMRRAASAAEIEVAFGEAALEADKAFGDPSLYLEKYVEGGRHIEFQVLCDAFGHAVHLGERECSIQRQHQKLVEEAPSPVVDRKTRTTLGRRVAETVGALGYRGAGTVEFLRDADGNFYFMEMNTRLQVEHPVTEMLTGTDLVAAQLEIAANRPLSLSQKTIRFSGHAIELRINAEDPDADFRPDPGRIERFVAPVADSADVRVRWDSAVREGYRIPPYYDSMIGKLIVHAPDRDAALAGAAAALGRLEIEGVRTTASFHRRLLADAGFKSGCYDVDYVASSGLLESAWPR